MKKTAFIEKTNGTMIKKNISGESCAQIIEKAKKDFEFAESGLEHRNDRGLDFVGYGRADSEIVSVRIKKV